MSSASFLWMAELNVGGEEPDRVVIRRLKELGSGHGGQRGRCELVGR